MAELKTYGRWDIEELEGILLTLGSMRIREQNQAIADNLVIAIEHLEAVKRQKEQAL
jgi:hypothetical protein